MIPWAWYLLGLGVWQCDILWQCLCLVTSDNCPGAGLWLVESDHVTWILAPDWSLVIAAWVPGSVWPGQQHRSVASQSEASIQVTWSLSTNQRPDSRSWDHCQPIRGQYPGHGITFSQSETSDYNIKFLPPLVSSSKKNIKFYNIILKSSVWSQRLKLDNIWSDSLFNWPWTISLTISIHTESHYVTLDTEPRPWACQCLLRVIM